MTTLPPTDGPSHDEAISQAPSGLYKTWYPNLELGREVGGPICVSVTLLLYSACSCIKPASTVTKGKSPVSTRALTLPIIKIANIIMVFVAAIVRKRIAGTQVGKTYVQYREVLEGTESPHLEPA
jgi:hypothetical protein